MRLQYRPRERRTTLLAFFSGDQDERQARRPLVVRVRDLHVGLEVPRARHEDFASRREMASFGLSRRSYLRPAVIGQGRGDDHWSWAKKASSSVSIWTFPPDRP